MRGSVGWQQIVTDNRLQRPAYPLSFPRESSNLGVLTKTKGVRARENQLKDLCIQKRNRSPWTLPPVWSVSLLWALWVAKADLSLHWVHRSFCWFYHAPAQSIAFNFPAIFRTAQHSSVHIVEPKISHVMALWITVMKNTKIIQPLWYVTFKK